MQERRRHPRTSSGIDLNFRMIKALGGSSSQTRNFSGGGISFSTLYHWVPGIMVELKIHLKGMANPVVTVAEVIWVQPNPENKLMNNVGLKFVKIDEHERQKIVRYVEDVERGHV